MRFLIALFAIFTCLGYSVQFQRFLRFLDDFNFQQKRDVTQFYQKKTINAKQNHEVFVGYIDIGPSIYNPNEQLGSTSKLFYQLFSADGTVISNAQALQKPIILWFDFLFTLIKFDRIQGGPGCSDWFGNGIEFGPYYVRNDTNQKGELTGYHFIENDYTWALDYHLLFIDQPYGVGYSVPLGNNTPVTNNSNECAIQVYNVLQQIWNIYGLGNIPFYIFGESYGGHYIPALAAYIIKQNKNFFNFQGVGLGDGWVNNLIQEAFYAQYFYTTGTISTGRYKKSMVLQGEIMEDILTGQYAASVPISDLQDNNYQQISGIADTVNYRIYAIDYNQNTLVNWLSTSEATEAFNVPFNMPQFSQGFQLCSDPVYVAFYPDFAESFESNFTLILENKRVLLYQGQVDANVPTATSLNWINSINWSGMKSFQHARKSIWQLQNGNSQYNAGTIKASGNLWYVLVNKAGHLVPRDQPYTALEMVRMFINGQDLLIQ